jgi:hypothetical protein
MPRTILPLSVGLVLAMSPVRQAAAVIQVERPLRDLILDRTEADGTTTGTAHILVAKVTKLDPERPTMVLVPAEQLKGKLPFDRLPVNLKASGEKDDTPKLLKRVADDLPVVVFIDKPADGKYQALAYTNGTWFSLIGYIDGERVRWSFVQCEPNFRRTFRGTTEEMTKTVKLVSARKQKPPALDKTAAPGLGPEIGEKAKAAAKAP